MDSPKVSHRTGGPVDVQLQPAPRDRPVAVTVGDSSFSVTGPGGMALLQPVKTTSQTTVTQSVTAGRVSMRTLFLQLLVLQPTPTLTPNFKVTTLPLSIQEEDKTDQISEEQSY